MIDPAWYLLGIAVQVLLTAFVGAQAWMIKRVLGGIDKQMDDHSKRLALVEQDNVGRAEFERIADDVDDTVSKEDWLRSHTSTQKQLGAIDRKLDELRGSQNAAVEIATAFAAALNRGEGKRP